MFENAIALDSKAHADHKLVSATDYHFAKNVLGAPLSMTEVVKASREFPIFFPTKGKFLPVAQMGYRENGNLYVNNEGEWTARYKPAHIRRFPFVLGEKQDAGRFIVMVNPDHVSPEGDGPPLFENGEMPEGGIVERARQFLIDFQKELQQTEALLKPLRDAEILVPQVYTVRRGEKTLGQVKDLQVVDKDKLAALDDALLASWVRSGLMGLIMAHLHSLDNWNSQTAFNSTESDAA